MSYESPPGNAKGSRLMLRMLEAMGVPRDGLLLVHSAFKAFSRNGYDAGVVLRTLVDYMEPGTLLLPTMSWRYVDPANPVFDELHTPSNAGILTEMFRREYATGACTQPTRWRGAACSWRSFSAHISWALLRAASTAPSENWRLTEGG
jgi:aminoglycoside N3'-acetyltransferase